ncbi:hypothetical protein XELAEV_18045490mg [Xenopus laevis]|uniref:Uncharacterized protein n=1 Tax=Xenopus laevis TaxID=8355 RepID=A0A974H4Q9_XENLA|nr:hypothetical protein XELAEV_18045490mg [Xenopus laevis]
MNDTHKKEKRGNEQRVVHGDRKEGGRKENSTSYMEIGAEDDIWEDEKRKYDELSLADTGLKWTCHPDIKICIIKVLFKLNMKSNLYFLLKHS